MIFATQLLLGAKRGDTSAQHNVGYFYDVGVGMKPNRAKALHWYKRSYRNGCRVAASNIATLFRDQKNSARALAWYQRAAGLHDGDANLEIANLLLLDPNKTRSAIKYLKRTIDAKRRDVTQAAQEEARRLLADIVRNTNSDRRSVQR